MAEQHPLWAALWDAGANALAVADSHGRIERANKRWVAWLGPAGQTVASTVAPHGEAAVAAPFIAPVGGETIVTPVGGDGSLVLLLSAVSIPGGNDCLLTARDISKEHRDRARLMQSVRALDNALFGYDVVDKNGLFVYANDAYLSMWGYDDLSEIVGTSASTHCAHPETPAAIIEALQSDGHVTLEFEALRKDGTTFDVLMAAQASTNERGEPVFIGTSLDITEVKRLRAERERTMRLEAMGRLAAGVAHDFNNNLTPILGHASILSQSATLDAEGREQLEQIIAAAKRSRELTGRLLSASRKSLARRRPTALDATILEVEKLVRRVLREDIELRVTVPERPCWVHADESQLHQVLMNLVANAQDAMPGGGRLDITLHSDEFANGIPCARVRVQDTGCGIPWTERERVFEPFYTTKRTLGTGLGLAGAKAIVEQHGGAIAVASGPNQGTAFVIELPLCGAPPRDDAEPAARTPKPGHGAVLLVEDVASVRSVVARMIRSLGYSVEAFASGAEAIEWLDAANVTVDVLLTDVVMPGMAGPEIARLVRDRVPGVRVLLMSGYAADNLPFDERETDGVSVLAKPFTQDELALGLKAALTLSPPRAASSG